MAAIAAWNNSRYFTGFGKNGYNFKNNFQIGFGDREVEGNEWGQSAVVEIDRFLVTAPFFLALTSQVTAFAAAVACLRCVWTVLGDVTSAVALVA